MRPVVGLRSVASIDRSVDLPAPLGPRRPRISPRRTSKEIRERARRRPKWRETSATATRSKSVLIVERRRPERAPKARVEGSSGDALATSLRPGMQVVELRVDRLELRHQFPLARGIALGRYGAGPLFHLELLELLHQLVALRAER